MDLVALAPWWAGAGLAVASYLVLHALASAPLPAARTAQDIGHLAVQGVWRGFAYAGQFIVPFICLMGALASALRRRARRGLVESVTRNDAADVFDGLTWQQFELVVGEDFRRKGFRVTETGAGGADGGVDLVLAKDGEKFLVQCKQWRAFKVGVAVVRELYGVMAARGAAGGFVVTSGRFTQEAAAFAAGRNIQLVDGQALMKQMRAAGAAQPGHGTGRAPASASGAPSMPGTPACPLCASDMVHRVARRGSAAGRGFWGCSAFPACKGTRTI